MIGSVAEDEVLTLPHPLREGRHLDAATTERRLGGGGANTAVPLARAPVLSGQTAAVGESVGSQHEEEDQDEAADRPSHISTPARHAYDPAPI